MSNVVGTPDWQRGAVAANKLLATVPAGTEQVTITVPANAQLVGVILSSAVVPSVATATGVVTGNTYPGEIRSVGLSDDAFPLLVFMVSTQIDEQIIIDVGAPAATATWWVFSLTTSELMVLAAIENLYQGNYATSTQRGINAMGFDGTLGKNISVDANGRTIPLVPTKGIDLAIVAGANALLAAPASGGNYLFALDVINTSGVTNTLTLSDASGNTIGKVALAAADPSFTLELQGFRVTTAVSVNAVAGADVVLRYAPGP